MIVQNAKNKRITIKSILQELKKVELEFNKKT